MSRKLILTLSLAGVSALYAGTAGAQQAPPPPPPHEGMIVQAGPEGDFVPPPFGERMELLGFGGMHGGKVVTGAPFSAVAVSETNQTMADGNHISRKTQSNIFRDSQGRVRRELTLVGFDPLAASGQPKSFVVINDPLRASLTCFILTRKAQRKWESLSPRWEGLCGKRCGTRWLPAQSGKLLMGI